MIQTVVVCPRCDGRPLVDPFEQRMDSSCVMCNGKGTIDPKLVCDCGRPAVTELKGKPVCLSLECTKRVQEEEKKPKYPTVPILNGFVKGKSKDSLETCEDEDPGMWDRLWGSL